MIPEQTIESILQASPITDVVERRGVKLRRSGSNYKCCCPFHDDKTPSMIVWPATGRWKCFGCGKGGDAISFAMEKNNLSYIEAVRELARDANITIEDRKTSPEEQRHQERKQRLYGLNESAAAFFQSRLSGHALDYALGRWKDTTLGLFRIGFAPDGWHDLYDHLKKNGFSDSEILAAGLVKKNNRGGYYDFYRNRLMFPVFNRVNRIVGFSGRDLSGKEDVAKYINSPDTDIYHKGEELFGMNLAIQSIRKYDVCILVEGNPDVVKLHQIGINNTVAACGTSLTEEQIRAIGRHTRNICLLYDNDRAGRSATTCNAQLITKLGMNALSLSIPDMEDGTKQDPDTYFTSKDQFANFYNQCKVNYLVSLARDKSENCVNDPDYKAKTIKDICALLFSRPANEQAALIEELSAVIPTKSLWNKTLKELNADRREEEKKKAEKERSAVQNEMYTKYGFYEKDHCYWFHNPKGEGMFCGSNFVMEPLFHIESTINAKRLYRITNVYGIERVVEFPQKDLISLSAFKLRCESLGNFLFDGGEYGLAKIKAYLYEKTQTCREVTQLGWQRQGFFAWSNGIFANGTFQPISRDGIVRHNDENFYLPALSSFYQADDSLFMFERKFVHRPGEISLYQWLDLFCKVYKDNAVVGFSFYVATLFRDVIVAHTRFFPILNIFGVKGSGKSEMAVSLTRLFGNLPVGLNMTNSTIAAMADHVAQTRNALCHIDEYKNSIEYDKVEFLKGLWDGTGRNRMNMDKDKKKEMTAVDAGIILTGQEMPKADIALFSRVIFTAFAKSSFNDIEKRLFNELKTMEKDGLTHITNQIIGHREQFVSQYMANYDNAGRDLEQWIDKNSVEDRIWRNWLVIIAALKTIRNFVELPFSYEKAVETMSAMIVTQNKETLKDNEVNTFWDIFSFLVKDGQIEEEYDYRIMHVTRFKTNKVDLERAMGVLVIDKTRVLQLYNKHCKTTGLKPLPLSTLKFYLQNSPEYLGEKIFKLRRRIDHLQDKQSQKENSSDYMNPETLYRTISTRADCFHYDALGIDIENTYTPLDEEEF